MSKFNSENIEVSASLSTTPTAYDEVYLTVPEHRRVAGKLLSLYLWGTDGSSLPTTMTLSAWVNDGDICLIPETSDIDVVEGKNTSGAWSAVLKVDVGMAPLRGWGGDIGFVITLAAGTATLTGGRLVWES